MAKKTSLKTAKDYIALTLSGVPKKEAAQKVGVAGDSQGVATIENSEAFRLLHTTMVNNHQLALTKDLHDLQSKVLRAQSDLIDQGSTLISEATSFEEKIQAQENQRRNIESTVIERADSWAGPNRNKDAGESSILEGIIIP